MNKTFWEVKQLKCEACIKITACILTLLYKKYVTGAVESYLCDPFNAKISYVDKFALLTSIRAIL